MSKNFIKLRESLFYNEYFFVDHNSFMLNDLLAAEDWVSPVTVKFGEHLCNESSDYVAIHCKVTKKHSKRFEYLLERLKNKLLLLGYLDYPAVCDTVVGIVTLA